MKREAIIVVGAGISGALLARALSDAGIDVLILEKSRGFGGRMATRRWDDQRFDHGAQFFTLRSERAREALQPLVDSGVLARWPGGEGAEANEERWIGRPGISAVARALAGGIRVMNGVRASEAIPDKEGWTVRLDDGGELRCRFLALTSPVPQSLAILHHAVGEMETPLRLRLESIAYDPCYALLAKMKHPATGAWRAGLQLMDDRIAWVADNQTKLQPREMGNGALVAHSTASFALRHEAADRDLVAERMAEAVEEILGLDLGERRAHWWKFASPASRIAEPVLFSNAPSPVLFCGDAFGAGKVEGAILSGIAAGEVARERLEPS